MFGTDAMRALFGEAQAVQAMLDVEAALARVQARLGLIPAAAAQAISAAAVVERLDLAAIAAGARVTGYPVVALVKELGRAAGPQASGWVHWGATTQDILDTALVLRMRAGLARIEAGLARVARGLAGLAETHRDTVMAGRTHLQHALPITFGYKCALWLAPLLNHLERLRQARPRVLVAQFGGAVGTLAALGGDGRAVTVGLAEELGLAVPDWPWHVCRDGPAEMACLLGLICGSLAKLATDVVLLAQTELGEVAEPHAPGRGGSSTMPQKRNPIAAEAVIAAARAVQALVPVMLGALAQDHERSSGPWQSEQLALPQMFVLTDGALAQAAILAEGLVVDGARMRANLEASHGLIMAEAAMMALAPRLGRDAAHHRVEQACDQAIRENRRLAEVLGGDVPLDPATYLGEAAAVVDRVLARAGLDLADQSATGTASGGTAGRA